MKRSRCGGREENEDRLSALPDCILLHILSFMNTKHVVRTCVLSKRWKELWKHVPTLLVKSSQFQRIALFTEFVTKFLSCRDDSAALFNLDFQRHGRVEPQILERMVTYAVSHNIQQLKISTPYRHELPSSIFSCQSLTSLELSVHPRLGIQFFLKSLSLAALTNLHLENFSFCASDDGQAEPFSNCKKLNSLVINYCTLWQSKIFCISNARVSNLVMRDCNITADKKIVLSTPNLRSFKFTTHRAHELAGSNLSFLEEVYIDTNFWLPSMKTALILNNWLRVFTHVKSMTLSSRTLQVLSLIPDLTKAQSPCFGNLNLLKVQTERSLGEPAVPSGVVDYLLQNSPSAKVTILEC